MGGIRGHMAANFNYRYWCEQNGMCISNGRFRQGHVEHCVGVMPFVVKRGVFRLPQARACLVSYSSDGIDRHGSADYPICANALPGL